jgi:hypothetical protein
MGSLEQIQSPIKIEIKNENSLYSSCIGYVRRANQCYTNKDFINNETLIPHQREKPEHYVARCKYTKHYNFFKFFIDQYFKALFSVEKKVKRDFNDYKILDTIYKNITNKGVDADLFFKNLGISSLITKTAYALVDQETDTIKKNIFATYIPFENVLDWKLDNEGFYEWVILKCDIWTSYNPTEKHKSEVFYCLYTKEYFQYYNCKGEKILLPQDYLPTPFGQNLIGHVPLVPLTLRDIDNNNVGDSFNECLLDMDIDILNIWSELREEMRQSSFPILVAPYIVPEKEIVEVTDPNTGEKRTKIIEKPMDLGTSYFFPVPLSIDGEKHITPYYLAPDIATIEMKMRTIIEYILPEMVRVAGFRGKGAIKSQAESGISKVIDLGDTNETIGGIAKNMSLYEKRFAYIVYLFTNIGKISPPFEEFSSNISINYPNKFDIINIDKEIEKLLDIIKDSSMQEASPTLWGEAIKKVFEDSVETDDKTKEKGSNEIKAFVENLLNPKQPENVQSLDKSEEYIPNTEDLQAVKAVRSQQEDKLLNAQR